MLAPRVDPLTRGVSDRVVDQLRVGARRERRILWFGRNCVLQVLDRVCPGAGDPVEVTEKQLCLSAQAGGAGGGGLARDLSPPTSSPAERSAVASPSPRLVSFASLAGGVNRFAAEKSSAAASGAPRLAANAAAASSSAAISSSGSVVQSAR